MSWIESMRGASILDVAAALGMEGSRSKGIRGCPVCGAESRHRKSKDKRGALGIAEGGGGWRCFQCDASGDAINLVAYRLRGDTLKGLDGDGAAEVREWCQRYTGGSAEPVKAGKGYRPPAPAQAAPEREPEPVREYPPEGDLAALWGACRRADESAPVKAWCEDRGLDATTIADRDLARALPAQGYELPAWARFGRNSWRRDGYHLLVPMYDARGVMRSVIARCVVEPRTFRDGGRAPKSVPPKGFKRSGLVMACGMGRRVLALGKLPRQWKAAGATLRATVVEGETDFLVESLQAGEAALYAPAVIGIVSGSVKAEIFERLPGGTNVWIATDDDDAGDAYAAKLVKLLGDRIVAGELVVERWRPAA